MRLPPSRLNRSRAVLTLFVVTALTSSWFLAWRDISASPTLVQDFPLTTTSDFLTGSLVRTGVVNNSGGEVQLLPIGVAGNWVTDTQQLPIARSQLAAVSAGNRIYVFGGVGSFDLPSRDVYLSAVVSNNLTQWVTQTNSLPVGLAGHVGLTASAGGNTYLYAIGGFDQNFNISNKIYYAVVNGDGSVGAWVTNTVPLPLALDFASGVVHNSRMYIIGGVQANANYTHTVFYAPINSNGSLGSWTQAASLPQTLAYAAAVVYNGTMSNTLYVVGGAKNSVNNSLDVFVADFLGDGTLTNWFTSTGNLPVPFNMHAAIQANEQIYIIGGNAGGVSATADPRKVVLSALIDESNSTRRLFDFGGGESWIETEPLPVPRRQHGAAIVGGELFAIGGYGENPPTPTRFTYHGPTTGAGASRYAPNGIYKSPIINVGGLHNMTDFSWSTVITNRTALTITMQYQTSTDGVIWSAWSPLFPSNSQQSSSINDPKSVTLTLNTTAQFFRYQAFFTTTANTVTPFLMESHLKIFIPPPDLTIRKEAQAASVPPGGLITYTIRYTNSGSLTASGVVITETMPANTAYVNTGAGWTQVGSTNRYYLPIPDVAAGGSGGASFTVRVDNPVPPGTTVVTNTVTIGGDPNETNLANNTFALLTYVSTLTPGVELRINNFSDGVYQLVAGQVVTYSIDYVNMGTDPAPNTTVTVTLPTGMTAPGGQGWNAVGGNAHTRSLGTVNSAATGSVPFAAQVDGNIGGNTFLTATAKIGFSGTDVDLSNNTKQDGGYVPYPNLRLFKDDGMAVVDRNQTLVYTLTYQNVGGALISNITLTETPPLPLVNVVGASGWTQVGNEYMRALGALSPNESKIVTFTVQVADTTPYGSIITNTARIQSSDDDPLQLGDNVARDADIVLLGGGPDLRILGASVLGSPITFRTTYVMVTVTNAGPVSTSLSFFLDMYVDDPPLTRSDLGETYETVDILGPGETRTVIIDWVFNQPGVRPLYFQADTCDTPQNCPDPSYGRVPESNENNNIFGPIILDIEAIENVKFIFLPLIRR